MTMTLPNRARSVPPAAIVTGALLYLMAALLQQRIPLPDDPCANPLLCQYISITDVEPPRPTPVDPTIEPIPPLEPIEPPIGTTSKNAPIVFAPIAPPSPGDFTLGGALAHPAPGLVAPPEPLDNAPALLVRRPQPQFPAIAISRGLSGYVDVRFDVLASGATTNIVVVASSDVLFEKAALKAARKLKFRARHVDGNAVISIGHEMRFRFEHDDQ
ncbi:MAG: TonB family protein [Pseudomonadota bacterium]